MEQGVRSDLLAVEVIPIKPVSGGFPKGLPEESL
jgi:hypothetical protein